MKCKIMHESSGRIRVHMIQKYMSLAQADILEYYLRSKKFVTGVKVFDRTCDAIISYTGERKNILPSSPNRQADSSPVNMKTNSYGA